MYGVHPYPLLLLFYSLLSLISKLEKNVILFMFWHATTDVSGVQSALAAIHFTHINFNAEEVLRYVHTLRSIRCYVLFPTVLDSSRNQLAENG